MSRFWILRLEKLFIGLDAYCNISLVRDEKSGKINLRLLRFSIFNEEDAEFYEFDEDKDVDLRIHYCRPCEKYTSRYNGKHYTLICAKNNWKLNVSNKSKECYCVDEQVHRFAMDDIRGELLEYFQYR